MAAVPSLLRFRQAPALLALALTGCAAYQPFDWRADLRSRLAARLGDAEASRVPVPFEIDEPLRELVARTFGPAGSEKRRTQEVLDFIFERVGLRYSLLPTRDAMSTFRDHEGNCLSFVNLFVAVARERRLNPFFVEVTDYQNWSYRDGQVVSQGHIVAGMQVDGQLRTYDFLPYRPKSYRSFQPIDDVTAIAHYYNNLGAEALFAGDLERAAGHLELAGKVAPDFVKAINNLGVLLARRGEPERAAETYRRGLERDPEDVALLTNLAAVSARLGRADEARQLYARIEGRNNTNPFFFLYQGESALARGDTAEAGRLMTEALRRDSESPEVHLGLVKLFMATGDLERARHHLARALRLDASHSEARRYAELLRDRAGGS
jgi:tetratricopeptide (TPR) repeat protein